MMKNSLHDWWVPFDRRSPQFSCPIHGQPERARTLLIAGLSTFAVGMAVVFVGGRPVVGLAEAFWIVGLGAAMVAGYGAIGIAACCPSCTCHSKSEVSDHG